MTGLEKLIQVQTALKCPKGNENTFGHYKYRSCEDILEEVKPLLAERKLFLQITDSIANAGDRYYVQATAKIVDAEDGTTLAVNTALAREESEKKGMDASQITGTASSYARKYCLNGLFLIDDTDDADTDAFHNATTESPKTNVQPKVVQNTTKTENIEKDKLQSLVDKVKDAPNVKIVENPVCKNCGKPIMPAKTLSAQEVANKTKVKYGKCLCVECAIKEKEAIEFQQKLK